VPEICLKHTERTMVLSFVMTTKYKRQVIHSSRRLGEYPVGSPAAL